MDGGDSVATEHVLTIVQSFTSDDVTAECSCGWERGATDEDDAVDRWENHCDVVFMEATGG